jgi:hypothetical protein
MLGGRDEGDVVRLEDLPEIVEVLEGAGDTVNLVGDNGVNLARAHVLHQFLDAGTLNVLPGIAGVLVNVGNLPALLGVDVDIIA